MVDSPATGAPSVPTRLRRRAGLVELAAVAVAVSAIGMLANNWSDTVLLISFGQPQPPVTAEQEERWSAWTLTWAAAVAVCFVAAAVRRRRFGGTMWWHLPASIVGLAAVAAFHVAPPEERPPADEPPRHDAVCYSGSVDCPGG